MKLVLETGVLHGFTSCVMLEAFNFLERGKLISIDMPSYFDNGPANKDGFEDTLPYKCHPGWIVPKRLNKFWELKIGKSKNILSNLNLESKLDLFVHDSEHTYETMMMEFKYAWKFLKKGGILLIDNANCSNAVGDFSAMVNKPVLYFLADKYKNISESKMRFGIILK